MFFFFCLFLKAYCIFYKVNIHIRNWLHYRYNDIVSDSIVLYNHRVWLRFYLMILRQGREKQRIPTEDSIKYRFIADR